MGLVSGLIGGEGFGSRRMTSGSTGLGGSGFEAAASTLAASGVSLG